MIGFTLQLSANEAQQFAQTGANSAVRHQS